MGALPDLLPGYRTVADDGGRARFEAAWGVPIGRERGLRIPEMFDAAIAGRAQGAVRHRGGHRADRSRRRTTLRPRCAPATSSSARRSSCPRTAERADVVLPAAVLPGEGRHVRQLRPPLPAGAARGRPARRGANRLRHRARGRRRARRTTSAVRTPAEALDECATPHAGLRRHLALQARPRGSPALAVPLRGRSRGGHAAPGAVRHPERARAAGGAAVPAARRDARRRLPVRPGHRPAPARTTTPAR